ncbi:hypothetical protein FOL47_000260 [Perkinsus chesapeaki]|uniref:Uncharacterized protein n=1 Tax=Perkinsus chesapeaki TaxID=330153 RepID=A0A7J6KWN4_PERCH|nr:hypothetical protein FOL47_000260 [Perkinsus chesapeaki]
MSSKIENQAADGEQAKNGHHRHHRSSRLGAANPTFKKLFNEGRPARLSDDDVVSYSTLKYYGPAIKSALQSDIQTKMLPEITEMNSSEAVDHLAELVNSMQAVIYRSVAHMVMDETFVKRIASEIDKGVSEAASGDEVKNVLEEALDSELEKCLSNELRQRLVPAMLNCVDSLTLKVTADQSAQIGELTKALETSQQTISSLSAKCKTLESRVRSLAQKQQFAGSAMSSQLSDVVDQLRALDRDEAFARQFDTSALSSPSRPMDSEVAELVLDQVRKQIIAPMASQMKSLQEEIRGMNGGSERRAPYTSSAIRRQMNELVARGRWDDAFEAVVDYTLDEARSKSPSEDVLQELLDMTSSQPEQWLTHALPGTSTPPLSTRPDLKIRLIEAITLQLRRPMEDITVSVVDTKMDWLRELALSLSASLIRSVPEATEVLGSVVDDLKSLEQDPRSFVSAQNIRDSDTAAQKLLLSKLGLIIRCIEALIR